MTCPEIGTWRAWIDGEAVIADPDRHLVGCPSCRSIVSDLRTSAEFTARAMALLSERAGFVESAATSIRGATLVSPGPLPSSLRREYRMAPIALPRRWRLASGLIAASAAAFLAFGTPAGQTATAQFLSQFRSQKIAVIPIDPAQTRDPFLDLERLGSVDEPGSTLSPVQVASIAEASARVGFTVKQPDPASLPPAYREQPRIQAQPGGALRFRFDLSKAREYVRSSGQNVTIPDKFNGAVLVVNVPPAAVLLYGGTSKSDSVLVVGQSGLVTAHTEGAVSLDEMRSLLLSLPGLSPTLVNQLKAIDDWRNTLPLPIPTSEFSWREMSIAGNPGVMLRDTGGLGSGAMWQRDSRIYGIAGTITQDELQRVAGGLR